MLRFRVLERQLVLAGGIFVRGIENIFKKKVDIFRLLCYKVSQRVSAVGS